MNVYDYFLKLQIPEQIATMGLIIAGVGIILSAVAAYYAYAAVAHSRRLERSTLRPNIFATAIFLNPWEIGSKEQMEAFAQTEGQINPIIVHRRTKDGDRDPIIRGLNTIKSATQIKLRGQVQVKNGGVAEARFDLVEQFVFFEGFPVAKPPDSKDVYALAKPQSDFNVSFEFDIPDLPIKPGALVYALRICYSDGKKSKFEERYIWYYVRSEDKWQNATNMIPQFDNIQRNLNWPELRPML